ncbi:MAG: DUF72 domain-containing protein [Saprospiraceae bacterium]|nr:DUF72 domain-containing protein [Saprospiraceae bacterium]
MKFGKLDDISQVDFRLPEEPSRNKLLLDNLPEQQTEIYIGCTGWSMKEWVGTVYPPGTKASEYVTHYTRQFNTIEFNSTHYRIPDIETVNRWRQQSAPGFKFCPKIPQVISHSRQLGVDDPKLPLFCERVTGLDEKLGCCFIQLPPYFGVDRLPVLERFLGQFPAEMPLAIEVRHASFFESETAANSFFQLLEKYDRTAVITDVAGRRDVLHMRLSNERTMIRFVGNGLVPSDYSRIDAWVIRLSEWAKAGLKEIYFFCHEPDNILAPDLSLYLFQQLRHLPGIKLRGPKLLDSNNGQQISLF